MKGHDVVLYDLNEKILHSAVREIERMLDFLIENRVVKTNRKGDVMSRISKTIHLADISDAEYVQESVVERLSVKIEVFKSVEKMVGHDVIMASSTSGLLMSDIQKNLNRPERTIVVHPFNPPHLMPLVEIVPGKRTSESTVNTVRKFMAGLGKEPILVKREIKGFAANRIQIVMLREILSLLDAGVIDAQDLEKMFSAGLGPRLAIMGPLAIYTLAGGVGGLETFLGHFKYLFQDVLNDVTTWTSMPESARAKAIRQAKELSTLKGKSYGRLVQWRDKRLIMILKYLGYI